MCILERYFDRAMFKRNENSEMIPLQALSSRQIAYFIFALVVWGLGLGCQEHTEKISFNAHIRPIFNEHCLRCHGGVKASGGFSLLFEEDAFQTTESGQPPIVRGNHQKSELYLRLIHQDPDVRMPLDHAPLKPEQIQRIAQWIDEGSHWEEHWAYIQPNPQIQPPQITPKTKPIDAFVQKRLLQHGLTPSSKATPASLARRVALDLTGLPPSSHLVQDYLDHPTSENYHALVDSLLASPHFGERWATMWLDLARYADTKGYEKDSNRSIWKYRDWVIDAFNADKPFDQFTIEQLAGDLLVNPTEDQLIATAFHRNAVSNDEGGTDDEEFRVASIIERIGTTYEVWQSTTMACVQCHSHPYDPFRQQDFYTSMAYFNNTADKDIYNEQPKLYQYPEQSAAFIQETMDWITTEIKDKAPFESNSSNLHQQKEALLEHIGYRMVEAEEYQASSDLIELSAPYLDMLWQIQDSSWIRYDDVDLTHVESMSFKVATALQNAGKITIHLDQLNSPPIGEVIITQTNEWEGWAWRRPNKEEYFKIFSTPIEQVKGKHQVYLRFWMGDTFIQHLFYLDKVYYHEADPLLDQLPRSVEVKAKALAEIEAFTTPILQELPPDKARKTFLFERGSWLSPGKEVYPSLPELFSQGNEPTPTDRLAFARWLVDLNNPLTARVIVNRIWAQLFGRGLVSTMEEFGSQGEKPSHPELLDWLAIQLMTKDHWQLKKLIKRMVLSDTYQQSNQSPASASEIDPDNVWLSRGPRHRLSGEQIRDQILAVSGMLNDKVGGPSVISPYSNVSVNRAPKWVIMGEDAKYRRSLYSFWQRTDPFPSMVTFDSPDRTVCTSQRVQTNTPLQALNLLNDELYFEAAKALATKMLASGSELDDQINFGYQQLMLKAISPEKLALLKQLYDAAYHQHQGENPQHHALTLVANALFNLDEALVRS